MKNDYLHTTLDLKYITYLLKNLYHSDLEIDCEGTSSIPPSKVFFPLKMHIRVQTYSNLSYPKPVTPFFKRIGLFIYEDALALSESLNPNLTKFAVIVIKCDVIEKWEYSEGKDVRTQIETNYQIKEETNEYKNGVNKGINAIENWFTASIPVIEQYNNLVGLH